MQLEEGAGLVSLARKAIAEYLQSGKKPAAINHKGALGEKHGVFVTIQSYPSHDLRGCIGYPLGVKALGESVVDCALSAAFEDSRFAPLCAQELSSCVLEVSVLSAPEKIKVGSPSQYPEKIKIGKDGLIIEYGYHSGLLLPQVPLEWNWGEVEFLEHLCEKAGLPKNMWRSPSVSIQRFGAQVFCEAKPGGKVSIKKMIR